MEIKDQGAQMEPLLPTVRDCGTGREGDSAAKAGGVQDEKCPAVPGCTSFPRSPFPGFGLALEGIDSGRLGKMRPGVKRTRPVARLAGSLGMRMVAVVVVWVGALGGGAGAD